MKFTYAYKTSDGRRHEASMEAGSREAVFEALRAQGIKAIKVVAADGSKANGASTDGGGRRGRRRLVIAALSLLLIVALSGGAAWVVAGRRAASADGAAQSFLTARTRRQVIGDLAVIEKGVNTGWADVFEHEGERFLASFAIPGVRAGQRNTTEEELLAAINRPSPRPARQDRFPLEAEQIVSMVEGMKAEARAYIRAGGSAVGYGRRLTERQDAEIAIYNRVRSEAEAARKTMPADAFEAFLDERNDELRNLGIRPVTLDE